MASFLQPKLWQFTPLDRPTGPLQYPRPRFQNDPMPNIEPHVHLGSKSISLTLLVFATSIGRYLTCRRVLDMMLSQFQRFRTTL